MTMQNSYALAMATLLAGRGFISHKEKQAVADSLKVFWEDYALDIWKFSDLAAECAHRGCPLSKDAAKEMLTSFENNLDKHQGLNWDRLNEVLLKWLSQQNWLALSDEERAEFNQETCVWAILMRDSERAEKSAIHILDAHKSLLDAVLFARQEHSQACSIEVFACSISATDGTWIERLTEEKLSEYGLLVWTSASEKNPGGI